MSLPSLDIPSYELTLPSNNKKVKYRPFLVKEHKSLLMMSDASDEEIFRITRELVDICTFNKLKVESLPPFDIEYIFTKIRAKSIGEYVALLITCRNCENKIPHKMDINDLQVKRNPRHNKKIMITESIGVEMKYPAYNIDLYKLIDEGLEKYFDTIENCIQAIYTTDGKYLDIDPADKEELHDFIASMSPDQFAKIEEFFATMPTLSQDISVTCNECQTINTATVEGLSNFFV